MAYERLFGGSTASSTGGASNPFFGDYDYSNTPAPTFNLEKEKQQLTRTTPEEQVKSQIALPSTQKKIPTPNADLYTSVGLSVPERAQELDRAESGDQEALRAQFYKLAPEKKRALAEMAIDDGNGNTVFGSSNDRSLAMFEQLKLPTQEFKKLTQTQLSAPTGQEVPVSQYRPDEAEDPLQSFGKGVIRGAVGTAKNLGSFVEGYLPGLGPDVGTPLKMWGLDTEEQNPQLRPGKNVASSFGEIKSAADIPNFIAGGLGELIPSVAGSLIAGTAGGLVGGPVGAAAGAGGFSFSQEAGSTYEQLMQKGVKPNDARVFGAAYGIPAAALDTIGPAMQLGKILNGTAGQLVKEGIKQEVMDTLVSKGLNYAKSIAVEGGTEALQQLLQNATFKFFDKNQDLTEGLAESLFFGGLGGGVFEIAGNTFEGGVEPTTPVVSDTLTRGKAGVKEEEKIIPPTTNAGEEEVKGRENLTKIEEQKRNLERMQDLAQRLSERYPDNPRFTEILTNTQDQLATIGASYSNALNQYLSNNKEEVVKTPNLEVSVSQTPNGQWAAQGKAMVQGMEFEVPFSQSEITENSDGALVDMIIKLQDWVTEQTNNTKVDDIAGLASVSENLDALLNKPSLKDVLSQPEKAMQANEMTFEEFSQQFQGQEELSSLSDFYGKARSNESVEALKAEVTRPIRELADDMGVSVQWVEHLTTPTGSRAFGSFVQDVTQGNIIKFNTEGGVPVVEPNTAYHEIGHLYFRTVATPEQRTMILDEVKQAMGKEVSDKQAEEYLVDDLKTYKDEGRTRLIEKLKERGAPEGMSQNRYVKFIQKFLEMIKGLVKWMKGAPKSQIEQFYQDVLSRKRPGERAAFEKETQKMDFEDVQEEYYQQPSELTSKFLKHKELQGKTVIGKEQLLNALKGAGLKEAEFLLIKNVVETEFQKEDKITITDLKRAVESELLPLAVIDSQAYADYGSVNTGIEFTKAVTHIYNSPIEHGLRGHFSGEKADGLFGHARTWEKGSIASIVEIQSDFFQKTRGEIPTDLIKKDIGFANARLDNAKSLYDVSKLSGFSEMQNVKLKDIVQDEDKAKPKEMRLIDFVNIQDFIKRFTRDLSTKNKDLGKYGDMSVKDAMEELVQYSNEKISEATDKFNVEIKNIKEKELSLAKNIVRLSPYKNIWQERIVKEEIRIAALNKKKVLRIATPETIAYIEGYISNEGNAPYGIDGEYRDVLPVGAHITFNDRDYTVLSSGRTNIQVAPTDEIQVFSNEEYADMNEKSATKFDDLYGGDNIFESFNKVYIVLSRGVVEELLQPMQYTGKQNMEFSLDDFPGAQRSVLDFYDKKVIPYFKKLRGDNVKEVKDDHGFSWIETKITPDDQQAVEAFQTEDFVEEKGEEFVKKNALSIGTMEDLTPQDMASIEAAVSGVRSLLEESAAEKKTVELVDTVRAFYRADAFLLQKYGFGFSEETFNEMRGIIDTLVERLNTQEEQINNGVVDIVDEKKRKRRPGAIINQTQKQREVAAYNKREGLRMARIRLIEDREKVAQARAQRNVNNRVAAMVYKTPGYTSFKDTSPQVVTTEKKLLKEKLRIETRAAVQGAKAQAKIIQELLRQKRIRGDLIANIKKLVKRVERFKKEDTTSSVNVEYQKQLIALVGTFQNSAVSQKTLEKFNKLSDWISNNPGLPLTPEVKEWHQNTLKRLGRKPLSEMNTEELGEVYNQLKALVDIGVGMTKTAQLMEKWEIDQQTRKLTSTTVKINQAQLKEHTAEGMADRAVWDKYHMGIAQFHSPLYVMNKFDGSPSDFSGQNVKLWKEIQSGEVESGAETIRAQEYLYEQYNAILPESTYEEDAYVTLIAMMVQGRTEQMQSIMREMSWGKVPDQIGRVDLEKAHLLIDVIRETYKRFGITDRLAAIYEAREGKPFRMTENYVTMTKYSNREDGNPDVAEIVVGAYETNSADTTPGSVQARKEGVKYTPRFDILNVAAESIGESLWYIHMQPRIDKAITLTNNPVYRAAGGSLASNYWESFLKTVAKKGIPDKSTQNYLGEFLRGGIVVSQLGFKLSTIALQPMAIIPAVLQANLLYGPEAAANIGMQFARHMNLFSKKVIDETLAESEALLVRAGTQGDTSVQEFVEENRRLKSGILKARAKLVQFAMQPMSALDIRTAGSVWKGMYDYLIAQGISEKQAKKDATMFMNMTQSGTNLVSNRPLIFNGGEFAKFLFTFQSYTMSMFSLVTQSWIKSGILKGTFGIKAKSLGTLILAGILFAVSDDLARKVREFVQGKKFVAESFQEYAMRMIKSAPGNLFGTAPILGNALRNFWESKTMGARLTPEYWFNVPSMAGFKNMIMGANKLSNSDEMADTMKGSMIFAEGAGEVIGVPGAVQMFDIAQRFVKDEETKKKEIIEEFARAFNKAGKDEVKYYNELINTMFPPSERTLKTEDEIKKIKSKWNDAIVNTGDNQYARILNDLQTNEEKAQALKNMQREMSSDEFRQLISYGQQYKVISDDTMKKFYLLK